MHIQACSTRVTIMRITDEKMLELAIEDYNEKERTRLAIRAQICASVTVGTLILAGSLAVVNLNIQSPPPLYIFVIHWIALCAVWLFTVLAFVWLAWKQGPTDYADVVPLHYHREWEEFRVGELQSFGYTYCNSAKIARSETAAKIYKSYCACSSVNNEQNQVRYRFLVPVTRCLRASAVALLFQAVTYFITTLLT